MKKHSTTAGSTGMARIRSLLAFRHQNPVARLVSVVVAFATAMFLAVGIGPAYAVHDNGMFELEGNIAHDGTAAYDWGSLFNGSGDTIATVDPDNGPLLAAGFRTDTATPDPSYFASSNKDGDSIASWSCGPANNPLDKDDLQHAYAALVHVPGDSPDLANRNHDVLYLGSDRLGNNGDAFAGFWLLKDSGVGCTSGSFNGHHTDGDLLIVSDYTNGGSAEHVKVYKWVGDDATGAPVLDADYNPSQCSGSVTDDNACADANDATIDAPWRSGIESNEFVETGIDMTHLLNGEAGCFSTFLAETRTSQELTAELKDFAAGQFNTCPPAPIATEATPGGSLVAPGTAQTDVATLSAVGGRGVPTGSVEFFLCQPDEVTAEGCPTGGTQVGGAVDVDPVTGIATSADTTDDNTPGTYCWRAEYTPDEAGALEYVANSHTNSTTECFTVVHASPTITTQIAPAAGGDPLGLGFTALTDTATLHDFVPGTVTGETVTFKLYDVTADPGCTGSVIATRSGTLSAGGVATTSTSYTPTLAHTYTWIASYPGDDFNDAATGLCSDANESATIVAAHIDVTKSANPPGPVSAGAAIGFDITVSNAGAFPATGVTVTDPLPAKADGVVSGDLNWSLSPAYTGCAITGAVGSQVLNCTLGTVAGGASLPPIHVQSATTPTDCGVVSNKATVATTNGTGEESGTAHVTILCPIVVVSPPSSKPPSVLPNTGGPGTWPLAVGLLLLLGGATLVASDRRRRRRS